MADYKTSDLTTLLGVDVDGASDLIEISDTSEGLSKKITPDELGEALGGGYDYILLEDQKAANTAGGASTSGTWKQRKLNTKVYDNGGHCTLSSNKFTLAEGVYTISASAPAHRANEHKIKVVSDPDGTPADVIIGGNAKHTSSQFIQNHAFLEGVLTVGSGGETYEIRHRVTSGYATDGFGVKCNFGVIEVYAQVKLWKIG